MYWVPKPYVCPKCDYLCEFSPSNPHPAPVTPLSQEPTCPQCWEEFLLASVGTMVPVDRPRSAG